MSTEMRLFPLADILSVTTGRMLSRDHMAGVYRILNYLTGDDLFTHQLPRAVEACGPVLLEQLPQLVGVQPPDGAAVAPLLAWLAAQEDAYGVSLPVLPVASWDRRNPLAELLERVAPERVIVVEVDE